MKNTSVSLFRQVLDLILKREFEEIVMKHNGEEHKQTFDSWGHFVSMIFCQLVHNSLREIYGGKLNHLGVGTVPSKSSRFFSVLSHDLPRNGEEPKHFLKGSNRIRPLSRHQADE